MTDDAIDIVAASRISRRVEIVEMSLSEIRANRKIDVGTGRRLTPTYEYDCVPTKVGDGVIEVACSYSFKVHSSDQELAEANMTYHIIYKLLGDEPAAESDIKQFARANGAYHSWPFVRETIFSLTSKMGFPPYTLPVLSFLPKPKPSAPASHETATSETGSEAASVPASTEAPPAK